MGVSYDIILVYRQTGGNERGVKLQSYGVCVLPSHIVKLPLVGNKVRHFPKGFGIKFVVLAPRKSMLKKQLILNRFASGLGHVHGGGEREEGQAQGMRRADHVHHRVS
jgi:hypothetical protein